MTLTTEAGWSAWPAPAKLNLFLRILGRRADGYHRLQTVFQLLNWGDTVHLRPRDDGQIQRIDSERYTVPANDDLVVRAAELLRKTAKIDKGVDIFVEKRIPVGGGFGGGSSDAATVLMALNLLWRAGLSAAILADLALQLGADVPVFIHGRNAWAEGIGEQLTPIELPHSWYLLVDSGVSVPTKSLFQSVELTRDATPATMGEFVSGVPLGNAFEPVLRNQQRAVDSALRVLSTFGQACLTGTGGGCFVAFMSHESAIEALHRLPTGLHAWVAAGARRSPLLDALAKYDH